MKRLFVALSILIATFVLPTVAETSEQEVERAVQLDQQAKALYQQGKYQEVVLLLQRVLAIKEKILGPEHVSIASSLNGLANLYETLSQYDKALPLYQRALAIREKVLGPEHSDTATSLDNLANLYRTLGQYDKALPLHQRALAIYEKVLGPEHSDTAISTQKPEIRAPNIQRAATY